MNKFDKELNKILLEQNLLDENAFLDGLKSVGNKIKGALNWGIDKIKSFFQKLWNLLTPDNSEESINKVKSVVSKIPGDLGQDLKKGIEIGQSQEFKEYLSQKVQMTYGKQKFNSMNIEQQKDFIKKCSTEYLNNSKLITENIINQFPITFTVISLIIAFFGIFIKSQTQWLDSDAEKAKNAEKEKAKQDQIKRENDIKNVEHQQYLDDQQRKQLFKLVAQSSYFN